MSGYYGWKRRRYGFGSAPMRSYRRTYAVRGRYSRPARLNGFYPGTRSSFRRVTLRRRLPGWGLIRRTYTIPELKYRDESASGVSIDESGISALFNGMEQGAANQRRIGQKIQMRSINFKYWITATGTTVASMVRIMVVLDMQPNGAQATPADVLEDPAVNFNIVSSLQMANSARFRVLWDKRYKIVGTSTIVTSEYLCFDETFQKLNHPVEYSDTSAGDITDIITGALFFLAFSTSATGANQPLITWWGRVRYHDN